MSVQPCCLSGFKWQGTPEGRVDKLANNEAYITGDESEAAVMLIHDLFGWTFPNIRLLADHYAREAKVTVYVPDFFGGEVLPADVILSGDWSTLDLPNYLKRNARDVREPELFECAKALRQRYKKVGAVGFCYGGWAVFRLGSKEHQPPLVDCITAGHPSLLTEKDIDEVEVPVQILAPEHDATYTDELKLHTFRRLGLNYVRSFDYQHFPGVEHSCFVRGDEGKPGERDAMVRGKNAVIAWMGQFLLHE